MKRNTLLLILPVSFALAGCQSPQLSAPPPATQIRCTIPKIEIVSDPVNKQTQSKGGLDITIVPALYKAARVDRTRVVPAQPTWGEAMTLGFTGGVPPGKVFVEETTTSELRSQPARVAFTVKIHNQLNRVFHGQGSVVQFNVDGKLVPFNNTDYKDFTGGIVPPLNDSDFQIFGPPLDLLKDKGTLTIFLYDVVTATDVAGNTTEKQNYTWDFTYTTQEITDTSTLRMQRGLIDIGEYQKITLEQQREQYRADQRAQAN